MTGFGGAALLRVSGVPIRLWQAAGNPDLFALLGELDRADERYRTLAADLAERIGSTLIPDDRLTAAQRRLALRLRRRLHRGEDVSAPGFAAGELAADLDRAVEWSAGRAALVRRAAAAVDAERDRLAAAPWALIHDNPRVAHAVRAAGPDTYADIARRVAAGEPWAGKRMRQRADYLWRMIARSATKSTPRQWLGQVALVPVAPDGTFPPAGVRDRLATDTIANIHDSRRELALDDPAARLTVAPLHRHDGGHLQFWVVDPDDPTRMRDLRLRRTGPLEAILTGLRTGPARVDDLLPGGSDGRRAVLRAFIDHLVGLGVIQLSTPPCRSVAGWRATAAEATAGRRASAGGAFVDVYRESAAPLSAGAVSQLQVLVRTAMRVSALLATPAPADPEIGTRPRPILDLVAERLKSGRPKSGVPTSAHGATEPVPGSGHARLRDWMATHAAGRAGIDITPALLDDLGAPPPALDWPVDAMLRIVGSATEGRRTEGRGNRPRAVLGHVSPAGVLDARFVGGLRVLHSGVPQADAYRQFLDHLTAATGIEFVEVLVPPPTDRAANAVRRPLYSRTWTGDPDLATYCGPVTGPRPRYLPLDEITLRRHQGRIVAEAGGRRIWPIYHATRSPAPPWTDVCRYLQAASRPPVPSLFPTDVSYGLLGDRPFTPRVTVAGALVLSCARWRIRPDQLWDAAATALDRARTLDRLRRRFDLPRWVFAASRPGGKPVAVDLAGLRAIPILDRLAAQAPPAGLALEEMLPAPDQLVVADAASRPDDRVAAELLLRLPYDESPAALANRLAPHLCELMEGGESNVEQRPVLRVGAG
jgi:hypothetical protein